MGNINNDSNSIVLPELLQRRIEQQYKTAQDMTNKIQAERDTIVRSLVLGYLASVEGSEDKHYELSEDHRVLLLK